MNNKIVVTLPPVESFGMVMTQEVEKDLDETLVLLGFARETTSKETDKTTLTYRQFGKAL